MLQLVLLVVVVGELEDLLPLLLLLLTLLLLLLLLLLLGAELLLLLLLLLECDLDDAVEALLEWWLVESQWRAGAGAGNNKPRGLWPTANTPRLRRTPVLLILVLVAV